jgi:DNA-binding GntR family transcriptional regulator
MTPARTPGRAAIDWRARVGALSSDRSLPLSTRVRDALFQAIVRGRIPPATHLPETPIADALGVSRVAVREAVRQLAAEGVAEIFPNRGAFTVDFSVQDLEEVFSLRSSLEVLGARLAASKAGRTDLARLEDVLDEMRAVERTQDRFDNAWVDARFHRVLMEVSGHRRALRAWHGMFAQITMVVYSSTSYFPDIDGLADRHRPIVDAIRAGDPDQAEDVIVRHIFDGGRLLLDSLRRDGASLASPYAAARPHAVVGAADPPS